MKSRTLHNTISQNLITLIKVGAFGASSNDCLMLMSPYKWEKLLLAAEQIKVLPLIAKGTEVLKEDIHLPNFIYELLESKKDIIKQQSDYNYDYSNAKLYNYFTSQRREGVINAETSSENISEDTLVLLDIIISVMDDMITNDINIHGLITLGKYIKLHKSGINYDKLNYWLSHIGLVQVASLEGNLLVKHLGFEKSDIPFLIKDYPKADRILFDNINNIFRGHNFSNATRFNIAMLETISFHFMKAITLITDIEE